METITRSERKVLLRLAELAYGRELGQELARLEAAFAEWRTGRLSPFTLTDLIHRFHDDDARDLFAIYTRGRPEQTVARGLALGLLAPEEVPAEARGKLELAVEYYRQEIALESPPVDNGALER